MIKTFAVAAAVLLLAVPAMAQTKPATTKPGPAATEDKYVGYYYPKPNSTASARTIAQTPPLLAP